MQNSMVSLLAMPKIKDTPVTQQLVTGRNATLIKLTFEAGANTIAAFVNGRIRLDLTWITTCFGSGLIIIAMNVSFKTELAQNQCNEGRTKGVMVWAKRVSEGLLRLCEQNFIVLFKAYEKSNRMVGHTRLYQN